MPLCRQRALPAMSRIPVLLGTLKAGLASQSRPLTGWQTLVSLASIHPPFTHPSMPSSRPPSLLLFLCESNPTGVANMVSGVLITVANRGSPSSDLCILVFNNGETHASPDLKEHREYQYSYVYGVSVDSLDT